MAALELLKTQRLELPLDPPLVNARGEWRHRSSLLVSVRDDAESQGVGEAAPLPGFSSDSLAECELALCAIDRARLAESSELTSVSAVLGAVTELLPVTVPAARFALETALLDRLGRRRGLPLWALIVEALAGAPGTDAAVPLCALLASHEPEAAKRAARSCARAGVGTFKLKIGPHRLQPAQLATLRALRSELGGGIQLRLDANGSLSREDLPSTLRQLAAFDPELVEEPLSEMDLSAYAESPCPLALDESLQRLDEASVDAFLALPNAHALVLKPTALGGIRRCLDLARRAASAGRRVIVSHTLEGAVGWAACAHLAIALRQPTAAGLWPLTHQRGMGPLVTGGWLIPGNLPGLGGAP